MIWDNWLVQTEPRVQYRKFLHMEYEERVEARPLLKQPLADIIHAYHTESAADANLLVALGFPACAAILRGDVRPRNGDIRKAHLAEILACEFAHQELGFDIPVRRLRYNPNPDQSMKGDDILGFRYQLTKDNQDLHCVLVGEAKYRTQFSSSMVKDALSALTRSFRPYPASLEFVATMVHLKGDRAKSNRIRYVKNLLTSGSTKVTRHNLLFIATEGRPIDPFRIVEQSGNTCANLRAVNVSFGPGIAGWIDEIYEEQVR